VLASGSRLPSGSSGLDRRLRDKTGWPVYGPPAALGVARTAAAGYSRGTRLDPPVALRQVAGTIGRVLPLSDTARAAWEVGPTPWETPPGETEKRKHRQVKQQNVLCE